MSLLALVFLCGIFLPADSLATNPDPSAQGERAAFLQEEIRLAKSKQLYLVLDSEAGTLTLKRQHVDLLTLPVEARAGLSRLGGIHRLTWPALSFTHDSKLPEIERPLVNPPQKAADDSTAVVPITVEALQAVRDRFLQGLPSSFQLSFAPDLDVIVRGESRPPTLADRRHRAGRSLAESWRNLGNLLTGHRPHRLRLLLVMTPQEARRLYLALEPELSLLVLPAG